jgi:hypothetical protein
MLGEDTYAPLAAEGSSRTARTPIHPLPRRPLGRAGRRDRPRAFVKVIAPRSNVPSTTAGGFPGPATAVMESVAQCSPWVAEPSGQNHFPNRRYSA